MIKSEKFEVTITGTHGVIIPLRLAKPFLDANKTRVALTAYHNNKKLNFHGKLHQRGDEILISFGKRYQTELGVTPKEHFWLQLFEDTSKYGVEVPEAFMVVLETDPEGFQLFERLSIGKKRSLIYYISRFKSAQTQIDKTLILCENLKRGITETKELIKQQW
ncbi:YdeI/OmpD-associated family protein [Rasiella rasia]|uniref:YdeI/OmpD-associated family protein n=1 Tax=Rasiella rasia TaxID=2744027 RepID=A0A6G6GKC9_9FLAO|nr:YdeI/OmpD-associated family protein [Rasiella rasia]QIE58151.1 YdeI/OmpD-associated family protein [Rasiella rasia]